MEALHSSANYFFFSTAKALLGRYSWQSAPPLLPLFVSPFATLHLIAAATGGRVYHQDPTSRTIAGKSRRLETESLPPAGLEEDANASLRGSPLAVCGC